MNTKETSISIPLAMHKSASARAKALDCSLSGYVRSLIRADLSMSNLKRTSTKVKAAIAHVEAKADLYDDGGAA
jgi:hypothetical protein